MFASSIKPDNLFLEREIRNRNDMPLVLRAASPAVPRLCRLGVPLVLKAFPKNVHGLKGVRFYFSFVCPKGPSTPPEKVLKP